MKTRLIFLIWISLTAILHAQEIRRATPVISKPPAVPAPATSPTAITNPPKPASTVPKAQSVSPTANATASADDIARFLAGITPISSGYLKNLAATRAWKSYSGDMAYGFGILNHVAFQRVRAFSAAQLAGVGTRGIFYPFSGPDFVYVSSMFPHATCYVLCGLEPVGEIPTATQLTPQMLGSALSGLHHSFHTLFSAGYFVTKDMRVSFRSNLVAGTLPILYIMLERTGHHIQSVKLLPNAVKITFNKLGVKGASPSRSLYYFSCDLSNGGLKKSRAILDLAKSVHADTAYIKSASYLLHADSFSAIRHALLAQCNAILQDDSGIPYHDFNSKKWSIRLYGLYTHPLSIFKQYYQPDLASAYARGASYAPLTFGVGYAWNPKTANLMLARKRTK